MSVCHIARSTAVGAVTVPPSKSYAHRLLIAAYLSGGKATVSNVDLSNDIRATIDCLKAIEAKGTLDCRESGSTLRFLIPVAIALNGGGRFTGTAKLFSRGIGEYEKIFKDQDIKYELSEDSLTVDGRLSSGIYQIDGSTSSQYITGLLFALPLLEGDSEIWITPPVQSRPYIDITTDVLRKAGLKARMDGNHIFIARGQSYNLPDCSVEGDWSNAAFLDIYNYLGGEVSLRGLNPDSLQGDKIYRDLFRRLDAGWCEIDLGNCIDLGPVLFTLAAIKHGARFINTARLRIKESDRVADISGELAKAGATAVIGDNTVEIKPIPASRRATLAGEGIVFDSHNDHRLAMSLTALATLFGARLEGCESVAKSFPGFFDTIKQLGIEVKDE